MHAMSLRCHNYIWRFNNAKTNAVGIIENITESVLKKIPHGALISFGQLNILHVNVFNKQYLMTN